jgi:uncharacterized RDD family membrane protein YckC
MTTNAIKVSSGGRLASMMLDHFIMTFLVTLIVLPGFALRIASAFEVSHEPADQFFGFGTTLFVMAIGFSVYFNKDIFNGRSPAKRALKMQVLNHKTGEVANPIRCLIRNTMTILWPLEVLVVLFSPQRRLGDLLAGTRVVYVLEPIKSKADSTKFGLAMLLSLGFALLLALPFWYVSSSMFSEDYPFVESTYDPAKSQEAKEVFEAELSELIKEADFRVYDGIENDNRRYVSGILYFQDWRDYEYFQESEQIIQNVLIEVFPLEHHVCRLKFIHRTQNSISTREKIYDSRR